MNNDDKFFTSPSLGAFSVWVCILCSFSFASGSQELQYFASHGWFAPLFAFFSVLILSGTSYIALEHARINKSENYSQWADGTYSMGKFAVIAVDLSVFISAIAVFSTTIPYASSAISSSLGIIPFFSDIITFAVIILFSIIGEKVFRKFTMLMAILMLIIFAIIIVVDLNQFMHNVSYLFNDKYINPEAAKWSIGGINDTCKGSLFNSLLWALTYVGFQFTIVTCIISLFNGANSKKESKGATILGFVTSVFISVGTCLFLMSGMPSIYTDLNGRLSPVTYMLDKLDIPLLNLLYPLFLILVSFSTATIFMYILIRRFNDIAFKKVKVGLFRRIFIVVTFLLISYTIYSFDLMWVIQVIYKYLGIFNLVLLILPLWISGLKQIKAYDQAEAEQKEEEISQKRIEKRKQARAEKKNIDSSAKSYDDINRDFLK